MAAHPLPRIGYPRQAGLPLAVEGCAPSLAQTKVVDAFARGPVSGTETPGSESNIRGETLAMLPLLYIRSPQSAYWLEADPGRCCPEPVPCDLSVQKMSNHSALNQSLSPPVWLTGLDLKDAYPHVRYDRAFTGFWLYLAEAGCSSPGLSP